MLIRGIEYKIIYLPVDEITELYGDAKNGTVILGYTDVKKEEIYVGSDMNDDGVRETLLHEIFEATNYHAGFKLRHDQIYNISNTLLSLIKDNPDYFKLTLPKKENKKRSNENI
jgi:lysine/ornithine N-monooxygenase